MEAHRGLITVSIVSHGHSAFVPALLADLAACPEVARVVLTHNIPEQDKGIVSTNRLLLVDNPTPRGFGDNHNKAFFKYSQTPFFAVVNPDIRLDGNPFPALLGCLQDNTVALCAPAVLNPTGELEDSARRFPTLGGLARKSLGVDDGRLSYGLDDVPLSVPWVAGMFMLVRGTDFTALGGFDEGYFLYYEDVDFCVRLWRIGRRVRLSPGGRVVHDARRASRHNLRHALWHAASMMRYFRKHIWRLPGMCNDGTEEFLGSTDGNGPR